MTRRHRYDYRALRPQLSVIVSGAQRPAQDAWLAEQGLSTLRLAAALVLRDMDAAVRTISGGLQHGD